jgi:hypothetical protein
VPLKGKIGSNEQLTGLMRKAAAIHPADISEWLNKFSLASK